MKRALSLALTIAMVFSALPVGVFATPVSVAEAYTESNSICQNGQHIYNNKNISSQYLKSEASCVDRAVYYYSCSCGEKGEQTFTSGSPLGHSYGTAVVENLPNGDSLGSAYQTCLRCLYKNVQSLASCSTCEGDGKVPQTKDCPKCLNGTSAYCSDCNGGCGEYGYFPCTKCGGSGTYYNGRELKTCPYCNGACDVYRWKDCTGCGGVGTNKIPGGCSNCNATGNIIVAQVDCPDCSGKGYHKHIEIQFDLLGGSNGPLPQISTSDQLIISSHWPTKSGYTFVGWNTLEDDINIYVPGDTYTGDSTTFFAVWLPACEECGGQGCFTSQATCPACDGVGTYNKQIYKCRDCGTTDRINHIVGLGRRCERCNTYNVYYVRTDTKECSSCVNGKVQNSRDCVACAATGYVKVSAPTLIAKTSTQVELLFIEGMEYSLDGTAWQSSNVFDDLSPATNYTFYQRVANNGSVPFGATSAPLTAVTACANEGAHNKDRNCICTICGIESHDLNDNCICTNCQAEKHVFDKKCVCINCGVEKHSLDSECICTECGLKHYLDEYCVCVGCGTPFHQFESDICNTCNGSTTDWDGSIATSYESGSGTSTDPYIISTGAQLAYLASQVKAKITYKDCYFELANDINLRGIEWNPIGTGSNYYFGGIFDGKGCVIQNLTITNSYSSAGLFGTAGRATICNVGVENINIDSTYSSSMSAVGGLVGFAQECTISNCYTEGTIYGNNTSSSYSAMVGGLIGRVYGSSFISNSYSSTTVLGASKGSKTYAGGLIGRLECKEATVVVTIENCYTVSTVRSVTYKSNSNAEAGGLIGNVEGYGMVNISKCFTECNVTGAGTYVKTDGFLAVSLNTIPTFRNCYYVCFDAGSSYSGVYASTTENFKSQIWLTNTLGWDFSNTWTIGSDQYPTLKVYFCNHSFTKEDTTYLKSAATCTSPAVYYRSCEFCGRKGTETFVVGHSLGHTEVIDTAIAPTCTAAGLAEGKHCSTCGVVIVAQKAIDALGHTEGAWITDTAATCTELGSKHQVCSVCDETINAEAIDALGHTEGDWIIDKEATATEEGSKHQVCSVCGDTIRTEVIGKHEHKYVSIVTEPTCTERGYTTHTCPCGESYVDTYIDAIDHTDGEWIIDKEATTTEEGSKHQICSECGDTIKTEVIPKKEVITGECGENAVWSFDLTTGVLTISGSGAMDDYSSVSLAPWKSYGVKRVLVEDNVTSIGNRAFYGCSTLAEITISDSVTSIGNAVFYDCDSLTSVAIPNSVTSIGSSAFEGCGGLVSVTVPNNVTSIGERAFLNCSSLKSTTIPSLVTSIGRYTFSACYSLTNISIPNSVTSIGDYAFRGCKGLINVDFEDGSNLISIGDEAFANCSSLESVNFGDNSNLTSIPYRAFYCCSNLTKVDFGENSKLTSIYPDAFMNCGNLMSITIPNGVTSIWGDAFWNCYRLVEVINHSSLNIFKDSHNNGYIAYNAIEVHSGESKIVNKDGYIFYTANKVNYLVRYIGNETELVLPESYNDESYVLNKHSFSGMDITSITIPNGVISIGNNAFSSCDSLTNVSISNSATLIGDYAFSYCDALTNITIPDNVTSIGVGVFRECENLMSVTIPDRIVSIGTDAFLFCDKLVYNTYDNACYLGNEKNPYVALIKTNDTSIASCKINKNTKCIASEALYDCSSLTSVTFDSLTTKIYDSSYTIPTSATIYGYAGSTAEAYATKYGRTFVSIHDHEYVSVVTEPTCTESGYTTHTCHCGYILVDSYVDAFGHTDGAAADCENAQICTVCGEVLNTAIGHTYKAVVTAPDCVNGGYTTHTCSVCGDSYKADYTAALGHLYDSDQDPDCNICGAVREVVVILYGDTNGDGKVNNRDLGLLQQHLNGWGVTVDLSSADVNNDGKVNNRDLGLLQQYLNGWGVTLG